MIQRSQISDSGVYACVVNNSVGEERIEITLLVAGNIVLRISDLEVTAMNMMNFIWPPDVLIQNC